MINTIIRYYRLCTKCSILTRDNACPVCGVKNEKSKEWEEIIVRISERNKHIFLKKKKSTSNHEWYDVVQHVYISKYTPVNMLLIKEAINGHDTETTWSINTRI